MGRSIQDVMKVEFNILPSRQVAHINTTSSVMGTISIINTWQKLDLLTGSPIIQMNGGLTWDSGNGRIIWDAANLLNFDLPLLFIGDAQLNITSTVSGTEDLQLGLVINGNTSSPVVVTPVSFTNQAKTSSFGANHDFSNYISPTPGDTRLSQGDYIEIFIKSTTSTPSFQVDGMNVTFLGR